MYFGTGEFVQDPYPTYRLLRDTGGAYWLEHPNRIASGGLWLFTRYDDVSAILRNADDISKDVTPLVPTDQLTPFDTSMLNSDLPRHTRLRSIASPVFSPARISALRARIVAVVDGLLDELIDQGDVDFVSRFAFPLPLTVISELLGVPRDDAPELKALTDDLVSGFDSALDTDEVKRRQRASMTRLTGYFDGLLSAASAPEGSVIATLRARERGPLPALAGSTPDADRADDLGLCLLLLVAGYETTANLLATGLLTLLRHPEQLERLRREPALLDAAVEEMVRFESPLQRASFRVTTRAVQIGTTRVEAGQQLAAVLGAANRDERQFPDPDRFDITRSPNRHLGFGSGAHRCLGERLARLEARVAFARLLERTSFLELGREPLRWRNKTMFRGLEELIVNARTSSS
jgi:cytochrome P450